MIYDPPLSYYRDEKGNCPRCGRPMNMGEPHEVYGRQGLPSDTGRGRWGYLPESAIDVHPFRSWRASRDSHFVRCGEGWHHYPKRDYHPGLDGPFPGYGELAAPAEVVREGPIYSDFDEEAGF